MDMVCKCGSKEFFTEEYGNQTGLYCSACGKMCDGLSYLKRSFKNSPDDFVELSEYSRNGEDSSEVHKEASGN